MSESELPKTPLEVFNSIPPKSPLFRHVCRELVLTGALDMATFRFTKPLEVAAVGLTKNYLSEDLKKAHEKPAHKPAEPKPHVNKGLKKIVEDGKVRWVSPKEYLRWKLEHIDEEKKAAEAAEAESSHVDVTTVDAEPEKPAEESPQKGRKRARKH